MVTKKNTTPKGKTIVKGKSKPDSKLKTRKMSITRDGIDFFKQAEKNAPNKQPLNRAFTKILPKVYERINYTPQELRLKFTQYVERSDINSEEICISGFAVYAQTSSTYLTEHKNSQEFSEVVDAIITIFESRYEQIGAKADFKYMMNNRFKGKRESVQKNENTNNINPEIKDILDEIINKKKPDGK